MMDNVNDCLGDNFKLNLIYTILLLATASSIRIKNPKGLFSHCRIIMNIDFFSLNAETESTVGLLGNDSNPPDIMAEVIEQKPSLLIRMAKRLVLISDKLITYIHSQFNEHTATSIASFSVLIIVVSIIFCFIMSLMREEERRLKEQYKKLNTGSSQSFIAIGSGSKLGSSAPTLLTSSLGDSGKTSSTNAYHKIQTQYNPLESHFHSRPYTNISNQINRSDSHKLHVIELRRETYFGLVRLLKPGCRTIVLLCDAQSRLKLLSRFYQNIYPYRKTKTLQFSFLLIEKNIGWYKDLLRLALNEKRDLDINPINCIGTVLVINGFKKYFSVYHASDSSFDPDEPFVLLEESLLDNLSVWLERLFAGRASRYYVKYWPEQMR